MSEGFTLHFPARVGDVMCPDGMAIAIHIVLVFAACVLSNEKQGGGK